MSNLSPLSNDAIAARNASHVFELSHKDLTEATNDTDQTIAVISLKAGDAIRLVNYDLETPLKDASDDDLDDTKLSLGITGTTALLMAATQANENGTEVVKAMGQNMPGALTAAAVTTVNGSDAGTTQTLANALKAELNKVIADLATLRTGPYYVVTADTNVILTVESMTGKALSNVDVGEAVFYLDIIRKN